ncbi:hypothetical protein [Pseudomonas sp. MF6747]
MKRICLAGLLACAALPAIGEEKLRIIDLGEPDPTTNQITSEPKPPATAPTARQALAFIERLRSTVEKGMEQLRSPQADPTLKRRQAQALAALEDEAQRFGVLFTPFHKCNEAAIDAASAWQGLIANDAKRFDNAFDSYAKAETECREAADQG